jgi:hypothetical protein
MSPVPLISPDGVPFQYRHDRPQIIPTCNRLHSRIRPSSSRLQHARRARAAAVRFVSATLDSQPARPTLDSQPVRSTPDSQPVLGLPPPTCGPQCASELHVSWSACHDEQRSNVGLLRSYALS